MSVLEITLVIIGVIFLLGSFFVQDRLSGADMKQIADVSEKEISMILEKQMQKASSAIEDKVDLAVEETYDATRQAIEKETREKLSAISQYSDTVIESVNKSHNEVMFLYSMLNDKHKELTALASEISKFSDDIRKKENEMMERIGVVSEMGMSDRPSQGRTNLAAKARPEVVRNIQSNEDSAMAEAMAESVKNASAEKKSASQSKNADRSVQASRKAKNEDGSEDGGKAGATPRTRRRTRKTASIPEIPVSGELAQANEEILRMHMEGLSEVEIAKALGRGLGEIRFVIGLYRGDVVR